MLNKKHLNSTEFQFREGGGEDVSLGGEGGRGQTGVRASIRRQRAGLSWPGEKVLAWGYVNREAREAGKGGCWLMSGPWWLVQHLAFHLECSGRVMRRGDLGMTVRFAD